MQSIRVIRNQCTVDSPYCNDYKYALERRSLEHRRPTPEDDLSRRMRSLDQTGLLELATQLSDAWQRAYGRDASPQLYCPLDAVQLQAQHDRVMAEYSRRLDAQNA